MQYQQGSPNPPYPPPPYGNMQQPEPQSGNSLPKWVVPLLTALILIMTAILGFGILMYTHVICFHEWDAATCDAPKTCSKCGRTEGEASPHHWKPASCTAPETCEVCGETRGQALAHTWMPADCEHPKTCSVCGATEGEALGHDWTAADCETPRYCRVCRKSDGEALGHSWLDADCDNPRRCANCGKTEGNALGHEWIAATPNQKEHCSRCGLERGSELSTTYYGSGYVQTKTGSNLMLRAEPSTSAKALVGIPQHTNLDLYYFGRDDWYFVHYKSYSGYVSASYIMPGYYTQAETNGGAAQYTDLVYTGRVHTQHGSPLNLRASASTSSESLDLIPDGTSLMLYDAGSGWYMTEYNGKVGYVKADYIKLD